MAPVAPETVGRDLGLYLMRFTMPEQVLAPEAVLTFLADLSTALETFVANMERFNETADHPGRHSRLALDRGICSISGKSPVDPTSDSRIVATVTPSLER